MLREQIMDAFSKLRLSGMQCAYDELSVLSHKRKDSGEKFLLGLLEAERVEREVRAMRYRLGQARFPVRNELEQFDFTSSPVSSARLNHLCQGDFILSATNVVFVGGSAPARPILP